MRLITFQNKAILDEAITNGIGRSTYRARNRVKDCDKEFSYELDDNDYSPIYCFATIKGGVPSLRTIGTEWPYFKGWMDFSNHVMIELEVPEEHILSMKDEFVFEEKEDKVIYRSDFQKIVNNVIDRRQYTYEALIRYIDRDWVVAYRTWPNDTKYGCINIDTVVINKTLCPLWENRITLCGDGYIRDPNLCNADNEEVRFGYAPYPKAILRPNDIDRYLPERVYGSVGIFDALYGILNELSAIAWITKNIGIHASDEEIRKFIKDRNYPSVSDIERILAIEGVEVFN